MIRRLTIGNIAYHNKKDEFLYNSLKKKQKAKSTKSTSRSDVVNIITTRTTKKFSFHA